MFAFLHQLIMQSSLFELGVQLFSHVPRDHMQGNFIPKNLKLPEPKPAPPPRERHLQRQLQVVSMCSCSAWCMIARRVSKPYICRLLMPHCLWEHGYEPEISCFKHFLVFACLWDCGRRFKCTHTMRSLAWVWVVVCAACKLHPCPSYSRRRDCINLGLLRSEDKGWGVQIRKPLLHPKRRQRFYSGALSGFQPSA